jgi:N-methylhydantoinase B
LGQRIEVSSAVDQDFMLFLSVERVETPAQGRFGGMPGAPGRIRIGQSGDLPGKGEMRVRAGEVLTFETPGGGGFGPPAARERTAVARDLSEGLISPQAAADIYGQEDIT